MSYMPCQSHPPWFDHNNNLRWRVQTMQLLIIKFSSASRRFIPPRSKYSPSQPVLKHCQYVFFLNVRDQV
jgi:hypothetical protein